jgi:hypothetical protein
MSGSSLRRPRKRSLRPDDWHCQDSWNSKIHGDCRRVVPALLGGAGVFHVVTAINGTFNFPAA